MAPGLYVKRVTFGLVAYLWALAIASLYFAATQTRQSSDHLVPFIVIAFMVSGLTLLLTAQFASRDLRGTDNQSNQRYPQSLPTLEDGFRKQGHARPTTNFLGRLPLLSQRKSRRGLALIIGCIFLRVVTLLETIGEIGCSRRCLEAIFLPSLIALYDCFESRKSLQTPDEVESMSHSIFQEIYFSLSLSRTRYLLPTSLMSYGIYLLGRNTASSTYICPIVSDREQKVAFAQIMDVVLDAAIIIGTWRLFRNNDPYRSRLKILGTLYMYAAAALSTVGIIVLLLNLGSKGWTPSLNYSGLWYGLRDGVAFAIVSLCVIHLVSELRPVHLVVLFVFAYVLNSEIQGACAYRAKFPPQSKSSKSIGLLLAIVSFAIFLRTYAISEASKTSHKHVRSVPTVLYLILVVMLAAIEPIYLTRSALVQSHPIYSLVYKARIEGDRWLTKASSSISLSTAVHEYQIRHRRRSPPPNFDKWYSFAIEHHCPVIDDYSQIDMDLLAFWELQPQEIKKRTLQQRFSNDVAVVLIRGGHADLASGASLDEKWPLNETVAMINKFSQWLPDMDFAIRIDEDSRPAVPWNQIEQSDIENFYGFMPLAALDSQSALTSKTRSLVPVFSRSKSPGHDDILIPGPNDFIDFSTPGPRDWVNIDEPRLNSKTFSEMEDILFWRGPADGESVSQEWQGMLQQRLVHLANNLSSADLVPMLLPSTVEDKFLWENVPSGELAGLFRMDIGFTKFESKEQEKEFGTRPDVPQEKLWDYRYLLDLDARGTSQRFILLLRSNSLPFRISTSRSWYDHRLMPWLHYVPQSARLNDVYSTIAYFAGLRGRLNGRDVDMRPQFRDAQFIANQGWKWAEKALRREDAEAYLFRLLLEWGRVTDDRRNEIGFQLDV